MPEQKKSKSSSLLGSVLRMAGWQRRARTAARRSEDEIQDWIAGRVAQTLGLTAEDVDLRVPFAEYGLDSRTAVGLSGELESWLDLKLPATLAWDFPTIESMARYLAAESAAKFAELDGENRLSGMQHVQRKTP